MANPESKHDLEGLGLKQKAVAWPSSGNTHIKQFWMNFRFEGALHIYLNLEI